MKWLFANLVTHALPAVRDFLFSIMVRLLIVLPLCWFVYAFGFAIRRCDNLWPEDCLMFVLGAPVGLAVMLGLAAEQAPELPGSGEIWISAFAVSIAWTTAAYGLQRRKMRS